MNEELIEQASEAALPVLCPRCTENLKHWSATLCAACGKNFRTIVLPTGVQTWDEASTQGLPVDEYLRGLLLRISNQSRELGRVNAEVEKLKNFLRLAHHGVRS